MLDLSLLSTLPDLDLRFLARMTDADYLEAATTMIDKSNYSSGSSSTRTPRSTPAQRVHARLWKTLGPREKEEMLRQQATPSELQLNALLSADPRTAYRYKFQAHVLSYYADFLFKAEKLIVELDGAVHNNTKAKMADARRTRRLVKAGYRVVRFWNAELRQPALVMHRIVAALAACNSKVAVGDVTLTEEVGQDLDTPPPPPPSLDMIMVSTRSRGRASYPTRHQSPRSA